MASLVLSTKRSGSSRNNFRRNPLAKPPFWTAAPTHLAPGQVYTPRPASLLSGSTLRWPCSLATKRSSFALGCFFLHTVHVRLSDHMA